MKVVLLPGLDGTGILFKELVEALPDNFDIEVISLDSLSASSYLEQAHQVASKFNNTTVFLVAESYSGRIAYELCDILRGKVVGLVFLASFVSSPSKISKLASFLPISFLKPYPINQWLIKKIGFGDYGDHNLVSRAFESISKAEKVKLKERLRNIARLDMPTKIHNVHAVYIRPTRDYLVSEKSVLAISKVFNNMRVVTLPGGHFIAQTNPEGCARIIRGMEAK